MNGNYWAKIVMLIWMAFVSLAAICWVGDNADRLDTLEHRVMILEGQSVAQQGVVEGMYYDKLAEDAKE